jgi:hypothetical protein
MANTVTNPGVRLAGLIADLGHKLKVGNISEEELSLFLKRKNPFEQEATVVAPSEHVPKENKFLRLLPGAEALAIPACDGTRTIAQAGNVFSYIEPDFTKWGLDVVGAATPAISMQMYEQVKSATLRQMLTSLSSDLDRLCLSQHQIGMFCEEHPEWLRQNDCPTLFLFKVGKKFFFALVRVGSGGLKVRVLRCERNSFVWRAEYLYRLAAPQLVL